MSTKEVWSSIRSQALALADREAFLAPQLEYLILEAPSLLDSLARLVAWVCGREPNLQAMANMLLDCVAEPTLFESTCVYDILAVRERDPACSSYLQVVLNLKGFHALVTYRFTHRLWHTGRRELAQWLASRSACLLGVDIHPAAAIGHGIMLDHATGIVIGETAIVEHNVSMLQDVTLGGTGKERGIRHPHICEGVMIGAGAKVLGRIKVGRGAKIGAGSVVLHSVPPYCTVVGIPAKIMRNPNPQPVEQPSVVV